LGMINSYYGMYGELFLEDGTLDWNGQFDEDVTLAQYVQDQINHSVIYYAAIENLAKQHGIEVTEEIQAELDATRAAIVEDRGGEEAFAFYLAQMGISEETFQRISSSNHLYNGLVEKVMEEGSPLYLEPAGYDQFATYADHILVATIDLTTREPLSEEEIAEKTTLAEDLLAQLQDTEGEELLTLFDKLADEYSEDSGRASNPNGYVYTPGTMVTEFEDAASALQPGQISGLVKSTYGYHIILRKDLAQGLEENPDQKATFAQTHLQSLLDTTIGSMEVVRSEILDTVNVADFYPAYQAKVEEMAAANAEASEGTENAAGSESENTDATGTEGE